MDTDEVAIFQRKDDDNCNLRGLYFTVVKKKAEDDDIIFYAIAGIPTSSGGILDDMFDEPDGGNETYRFENQIAVIFCSHGWIDALHVFDQSFRKEGPFENPRRCGIGTVLSELCLIDPEIYNPRDPNMARSYLKKYPIKLEDCHKLVGLTMLTKSRASLTDTSVLVPAAGHTYLTAALSTKYEKLVIAPSTDSSSDSSNGSPSTNPFWIYDIQVAKDNYDSRTGHIDECCGNERCDAYGQHWFFCSDTRKRRRSEDE